MCEIVRIYLLEKLSPLLTKENLGLCRDHGLVTFNSSSGPVHDRMRKDISVFKNEGLSITIETNLIETDFLIFIQPIINKNISRSERLTTKLYI